MNRTIVWQVAVRYHTSKEWRTLRIGRAFETQRAARERATQLQRTKNAGSRERWFAAPLTLVSE